MHIYDAARFPQAPSPRVAPTHAAVADYRLLQKRIGTSRTIVVQPDEAMGRTRAAKNFALALEGKEAPLNTPDEAVKLMKIIDGIYASAKTGKPVEIK